MSITVMKQALEALDTCNWDYDNDENSYKTYDEDAVNDAITALRQAIEQVEKQEHVEESANSTKPVAESETAKSWEQKPVAWIHRIIKNGELLATHVNQVPPEKYEKWWTSYPLYAAPPRKGWIGLTDEDLFVCDEDGLILAKYWEAKLKERNK